MTMEEVVGEIDIFISATGKFCFCACPYELIYAHAYVSIYMCRASCDISRASTHVRLLAHARIQLYGHCTNLALVHSYMLMYSMACNAHICNYTQQHSCVSLHVEACSLAIDPHIGFLLGFLDMVDLALNE